MVHCSECKLNILVTQRRIKCTNPDCQHNYHQDCVKYNDTTTARSKWICPDCTIPRPKSGNTPLSMSKNKDISDASAPLLGSQELILLEIRNLRQEMLDKFECQKSAFERFNAILCKVQMDMSELDSKCSGLREDLNGAINTLQFLSACHDDQQKLNEKTKSDFLEFTKCSNSLQPKLSELNHKIAYMEQFARQSNVEIQGIPERRNENLMSIVKKIGNTVSCNLQETDILEFHRVAKQNTNSNRPKNIVVKLNCPRTRDNLLASVKIFNKNKHSDNKLNTSHIELPGERRPVYVTEHLSPENKKLHAATRIAAKEKNYKFVWIRNGRIFVRKDISAGHINIKTVECLHKL